MHSSSAVRYLFLRMGDHLEWGVAGRFSLSMGECTTRARGKGTWRSETVYSAASVRLIDVWMVVITSLRQWRSQVIGIVWAPTIHLPISLALVHALQDRRTNMVLWPGMCLARPGLRYATGLRLNPSMCSLQTAVITWEVLQVTNTGVRRSRNEAK